MAPGLLHHYFPQVDDLIAEVFATAVGRDLDELGVSLSRCRGETEPADADDLEQFDDGKVDDERVPVAPYR